MRLYDTHCHFEAADPSAIAATLDRARTAGVEKLMAVGGSAALNGSALVAAQCAAEAIVSPQVRVALGYDRDQTAACRADPDAACRQLATLLADNPTVAAVGEIGLDYHYSPETRADQLALFGAELELARQRDLPVVIHTREADNDTLSLLREIPSRGIIHCYTGTCEFARQFLDLGFFISISGIVTFRPAENVRDVTRFIPDDRFLIETDSPFLAPVPLRGKPNEPANVALTCAFIAKLRGLDAEDFAALTFANAERVIG